MSVRFEGYAAVWDRVDRAGDVFRTGAFAGAQVVPLLCQHRGGAVGVIEAIGEDARGLRVGGRVDAPALAAAVRAGALAGLSVGYRPLAVARGRARELIRVQLIEVSLVAVPMQPAARIDRVYQEENV